MESEETLEEIVVTGARWYRLLSSDDWVAIALLATGLMIAFLVWRRRTGNCMSLLQKTVLASASGVLCYVVFHFGFDGAWPAPLFFGVSGTLFAAGVLFPYVRPGKVALIKYIGLIFVSAASYWSAIEIVSKGIELFSKGTLPDWEDYLFASLAGAFIALFGARLIIPLHNSLTLAVAGSLAATVGGLFFEFPYAYFLPHMVWHMLMAIAIHIATGSSWNLGRR